MSNTGLLTIVNLKNIVGTLTACRSYALKTLYIQIHPEYLKKSSLCTRYFGVIQDFYTNSTKMFDQNLDLRFVVSNLKTTGDFKIRKNVDYLFFDYSLAIHDSQEILKCYSGTNVIEINPADFIIDFEASENGLKIYDNVVLGGTFDRLHTGHKILLTQAVLQCKKRLVVGVTDDNMIKSKKLAELILPVADRILGVKDFLTDIDNSINYEIVPISDPFGPTATDPDMDLIVVSDETVKGGNKVNELRKERNLKELEISVLCLVNDINATEDKEIKISSSNQRMDLLGTRLKPVQPRPNLNAKPYLIGLTGGVGSGKSIMCKRFEEMGAGIIDCDKIAHQLYEPGEKCYQSLVDLFGQEIVAPDSKINRKKLGEIVFNDKSKLNDLNKLMWNAIMERTMEIANEMYEKDKKDVVIAEGAVLIEAGWTESFHEVWCCIIPADVAVPRIVERNKLSEAEARRRIENQITNKTIVQHSNIVFSTFWSYEFSQKQAERAWNILMGDLNSADR